MPVPGRDWLSLVLRGGNPPGGQQICCKDADEAGRCAGDPRPMGPVDDVEAAWAAAAAVGYPVLLKASAGGGGRGIRRVYREEELQEAFESARAEAVACFGNGEMYLEKLILRPRTLRCRYWQTATGCHLWETGTALCSGEIKAFGGGSCLGPGPGAAGGNGTGCRTGCPGSGLRKRRHGGVPVGPRWASFLLYGDEHPDSSGAWHHGNGERRGLAWNSCGLHPVCPLCDPGGGVHITATP